MNSTARAPDPRPGNPAHPAYRADIDGLRAIAVLSVVGFHAFPMAVPGGFAGVDIFFVISGFLISTLIFEGLQQGSFRFAAFYGRRIRRIFPAVLVVLVATLAFGWFVLLADEYKQAGKHVAGGAGFVSNLVLWGESGYFDDAAATKPLLHLWSLGIEEQFYIAWPLLLWLAWKCRASLLAVVVAVAAASFMFNLATYSIDPVADFYSPLTRFWELLAGSMLAWMKIRRPDAVAALAARAGAAGGLALFGAACMAAAFALLSGGQPYPGLWAVLPVLGTVLVIAAGPAAWLNRALLSKPPLVWFGLISYPLYAWHWPILSFARIVEGRAPGAAVRVAAVLASIALAWLTYRLIEVPIRFGARASLKTTALVLVMSIAGMAGYAIYRADGIESRAVARLYRHIGEARADWTYPKGLARIEREGVTLYASDARPPRVLLFGDSHVEQFGPRVAQLSARGGLPPTALLTGGGCPAIPDVYDDQHPGCRDLVARFERLLEQTPEARTVVIGGCWNCYFIDMVRPPSGEGRSYDYYYERDGVKARFRGENGTTLALASLGRFLAKLAKTHTVFLLLDNPSSLYFDPRSMVKNRLASSPAELLAETAPPPAEQVALNDTLRALGLAAGVRVIDQLPAICPGNACARFDRDGRPIYWNDSHLRSLFVIESAGYLDAIWGR